MPTSEWQWSLERFGDDDEEGDDETTLYKWLARNCHGHYSTSSRIAWAKREGRPMNFMFENDRDAVLAKLFHGGA